MVVRKEPDVRLGSRSARMVKQAEVSWEEWRGKSLGGCPLGGDAGTGQGAGGRGQEAAEDWESVGQSRKRRQRFLRRPSLAVWAMGG